LSVERVIRRGIVRAAEWWSAKLVLLWFVLKQACSFAVRSRASCMDDEGVGIGWTPSSQNIAIICGAAVASFLVIFAAVVIGVTNEIIIARRCGPLQRIVHRPKGLARALLPLPPLVQLAAPAAFALQVHPVGARGRPGRRRLPLHRHEPGARRRHRHPRSAQPRRRAARRGSRPRVPRLLRQLPPGLPVAGA